MLRILIAPLLVALLALSGCGGGDDVSAGAGGKRIRADKANAGKAITLGSKGFTESLIVAQIYGQALTAAGYEVRYDLDFADEQVATRAMQSGQIDGYPEYTGTALTALLGAEPGEIPKDEQQAYELVKRRYAERFGFVALPQTPFTDSNALGMTREKAEELGDPKTISDLRGKAQKLTLAGSSECFRRMDCALGFERVYGLRFKRKIRIDLSERHEVILQDKADLTIPFTTDGQIAANDEVILEDDKNLFPPYNVTFVVTKKKADELGADLEPTITKVQRGLTTPVMQELNSRADLDKQPPARVATDYLRRGGFVR